MKWRSPIIMNKYSNVYFCDFQGLNEMKWRPKVPGPKDLKGKLRVFRRRNWLFSPSKKGFCLWRRSRGQGHLPPSHQPPPGSKETGQAWPPGRSRGEAEQLAWQRVLRSLWFRPGGQGWPEASSGWGQQGTDSSCDCVGWSARVHGQPRGWVSCPRPPCSPWGCLPTAGHPTGTRNSRPSSPPRWDPSTPAPQADQPGPLPVTVSAGSGIPPVP